MQLGQSQRLRQPSRITNIGNGWQHNAAHRQGVRYNNANVQQRFGNNNLKAGAADRMDFRGRDGQQVLRPNRGPGPGGLGSRGDRAGDRVIEAGGDRGNRPSTRRIVPRGWAGQCAPRRRNRNADRGGAAARRGGGRGSALNVSSGRAAAAQSARGRASVAQRAAEALPSFAGRGGGGGGCAAVVGEVVFEAAVEAVAAAVGDAPTSH